METIQHILDLQQTIKPLNDQITIAAKVATVVALAYIRSRRAAH